MHDIKWIRENGEAFDRALQNRNKPPMAAELIAIDERLRARMTELQTMQAQANSAAKAIGIAMGKKDFDEAERLKAETAKSKSIIQSGEYEVATWAEELQDLLAGIPNVPFDDVPVGKDEHDNVELHRVGTPKIYDFAPKQHFELGEALGLMDFETAAKISGARFVILKGALARLERALGQFMLDVHTNEHGYTEVNPPFLTKADAMYGTTQLPKFEEDLFSTSKTVSIEQALDSAYQSSDIMDLIHKKLMSYGEQNFVTWESKQKLANLAFDSVRQSLLERAKSESGTQKYYLIPTAEVPLTNMVREQILDDTALPFRFTALTPSFRSEAGSAGRDTRGMIRLHQFFKAELVSITTAETSDEEHKRMLKCAETILEKLGLPFRTVTLCTGDMGFASKKTYDIEVWLPGQNAYREISSCSNCGDFQARRMNARYRPNGQKGTQFVHTLNGSGVAVGRALVAVMENYQNADGSITVPDVLKPYMGGIDKIGG
jgi:seryl-tRNA synthetase